MDLREAVFGPRQVGVRRLLSLVQNLPRDSQLAQVTLGVRAHWSQTDELMARMVNETAMHRYLWMRSKGIEVEPPDLVESPWAPEPEAPVMDSGTSLASFLGAPITYQGG